jgi:hypothetical protein
MKVIFLDIDGVLCNHESIAAGYKARTCAEQDPYGPHVDCVAALNRVIEQTGAFIVLSSTWRKAGDAHKRMPLTLKRWGVEGTMIGCTPFWSYDVHRGAEIRRWIETVRTPVTSFVILDDDSDMGNLTHRLVKTDHIVGLTEADADRAIAILNALPTDLLIDRMFREAKQL